MSSATEANVMAAPMTNMSNPSDKTVDAPPPALEPAAPKVVSKWAIHRRMYNWVLSFAHHKHSTAALATLSFAESSFFPIPPDVLQIALTLERRDRSFFYATVSTIASVFGGMFGYLIGFALWSAVSGFFFSYVFKEDVFNNVQSLYQRYDFWCVFIAAFTPIPYKVFTIAAGVFSVSFPMFVLASAIGRGARFFIVAWMLHHYGPPIKTFIEKYFNILSLAFGVVLVGAFALLKLLA